MFEKARQMGATMGTTYSAIEAILKTLKENEMPSHYKIPEKPLACVICGKPLRGSKDEASHHSVVYSRTLLGGIMEPSCSFDCAQITRAAMRKERYGNGLAGRNK